jgi:aerobic-type carbon monoxide dehydrogenase small subunit (CoxS/CutS family)
MATLTINGTQHRIDADPSTPLVFVLRNDLQLFGAKLGCGSEQCGACLVLLEGRPAYSCTLTLDAVRGRPITTLEGLGTAARPHALQRAFLAENAAQCGFCTAGIIVRAAALLDANPAPTDAEIRAALAGNLCRCGAHPRVLRAIRRAANEMAEARDG